MCYVYELNKQRYIFIHIPKSCGRHIRETIRKQYPKIIFNGWDVQSNFDKAHVPRCLLFRYVRTIATYNMFTYVRNPYDRAVSTYGHMCKTAKKTPEGFVQFVKERLANMKFVPDYNAKIIHAYPQHMFLTDMRGDIDPKIEIRKIEDYEAPPVYNRELYYANAQVREIVERIYRHDFEVFGYPLLSGTTVVPPPPIMARAPTPTPSPSPMPVTLETTRAWLTNMKKKHIPKCYFSHPMQMKPAMRFKGTTTMNKVTTTNKGTTTDKGTADKGTATKKD